METLILKFCVAKPRRLKPPVCFVSRNEERNLGGGLPLPIAGAAGHRGGKCAEAAGEKSKVALNKDIPVCAKASGGIAVYNRCSAAPNAGMMAAYNCRITSRYGANDKGHLRYYITGKRDLSYTRTLTRRYAPAAADGQKNERTI